MRRIATIALMGGALIAAPVALQLPVALSAGASIAVGVVIAGVACEGFTALALASGGLAALAWHALAGESLVMAGAVFVALALAPRSLRGRSSRWRGAHFVVSAFSGAVAASVAARYGGADSSAVRAAAVAVAGLIASTTLLLPVDDMVAHALASLMRELPGEPGERLVRAVGLRRRIADCPSMEALADATGARVELAWRALVEIASQRVAMAGLAGQGISVLDGRIAQHVDALERIHAAADERYARAAGLTDARLMAARLDGEDLETEVRALIEVAPN